MNYFIIGSAGYLARVIRLSLSVYALVWLSIVDAAPEIQAIEFVGKAYDMHTNELIYIEEHRLEQEDGVPRQATVIYVTPGGEHLAQKEMIYWRPERPAYRLTVVNPDRVEVVEHGEDGVFIESVKSGFLRWSNDTTSVIDGGFHYFIIDHFDVLLAGDTVDFQFLAPTRSRWLDLRVSPAGQSEGRLMLELNLQNRLLSWIVNAIELVYDIETRSLLRYSGLTNLPRPSGGHYTANIEYHYSQEDLP